MLVSRLRATLATEPILWTVRLPSLAVAFAGVPDPRRQASVTYPLAAVLSLAVAALLANHTSVLAMAEWGRRQSRAVLTELGLPERGAPCPSTSSGCCGALTRMPSPPSSVPISRPPQPHPRPRAARRA
jgi:hypothetical protein